MNTTWKTILGTGLATALAACGGGGGSGGGSDGYGTTGELNLAITDAPVDEASAVWVTITGMTLKRTEGGNEKSVKLNGTNTQNNEIEVNLLTLANGGSAALFADQITAGDYQWIRFDVEKACIAFIPNANKNNPNECIPMDLPAQNELKTSGSFNVPSNGIANITVDWDLRKAIVEEGTGDYKLKPVLHLRDDADVGAISGVIQGDEAECAEDEVAAVYVFSGIVTPDDMDEMGVEPFASVRVQDNFPEDDSFFIGMLDPGSYTMAYTCDALADEPETSNPIGFFEPMAVEVVAGEQTAVVYIPVIPAS